MPLKLMTLLMEIQVFKLRSLDPLFPADRHFDATYDRDDFAKQDDWDKYEQMVAGIEEIDAKSR